MTPTVSFVVRTYNEEKFIGALLESIANQSYESEIEVIIVDSESTDCTVQIAKSFPQCKVISIKKSNFTYGFALNVGFAHARGLYICVVSGHCILLNNLYVSNIVKEFELNRNVGIVFGPHEGNETSRSSERSYFKHTFRDAAQTFPNNANCAYRKSLWDQINFDERLSGLEDKDFALKAASLGYEYCYLNSVGVLHIHNESNLQVFRRFYRETFADMEICGKSRMVSSMLILQFIQDIFRDVIYVTNNNKFRKSFKGVLGFRISQYLGLWFGQYIFIKKRPPLMGLVLFKLFFPAALVKNEIKI